MRILAIETSTEYCSVALLQNGKLDTVSEQAGQRHSEILLSMIDQMLSEQRLKLAQLDAIAFGAGPGSFTGVRIAASAVQGLAFGAGLPVVSVNTLEALAEQSGHERIVCALDARLDEVYFAAYEKSGQGWNVVVEPCLTPIGALEPLPGGGWKGIGSGFAILDRQLEKHLGIVQAESDRVPQAAEIAMLAARAVQTGNAVEAAKAQPIYLRNKVAMTIAERHARGYK